jgi:hypothetical protein
MGQSTLKALARAHSMKSSVCGEEECTRACTRVRTYTQIKVDCVKQTSYTLQTDWQQANSAARSRYAVLRKANFITFETQKTTYFPKISHPRSYCALEIQKQPCVSGKNKVDTLNQTSFFSASLQYTLISNSRLGITQSQTLMKHNVFTQTNSHQTQSSPSAINARASTRTH